MQNDIGVLAAELYFPKTYVPQAVMEEHFKCPDKYTKGLGQKAMSVCDTAEDVVSLALTVTHRLIERTGLDLTKVGFLEVGSETLIDKSKAIKTHLMQLFEESGNFDVAGIDVKSACYGGTAAFFNAINWLESSSCDGRLALVVAADIATYSTPATQPTGGAGAVALLLGPHASLIVDSGLRVSAMRHRYDFYKPKMQSIFPEVDGKLSITCYKEALLSCYDLYCKKVDKLVGRKVSVVGETGRCGFPIDYLCFHSPFCRLVAKSFAWLVLKDVKNSVTPAASIVDDNNSASETHASATNTATDDLIRQLMPYVDAADSTEVIREVDEACLAASQSLFDSKVAPSLRIASEVGNMYTASLYSCLVSLACSVDCVDIRGKRILMFSYGSGYTASMFSLRATETADIEKIFGASSQSPFDRLAQRTPICYADFVASLEARESAVDLAHVETPVENLEKRLFPGTYYLTSIDGQFRRSYARFTPGDSKENGEERH